jgi:alkyl sulfatase BDS1-like metallo-beta-lactamase superfamily hydrolase
LFTDEHHPDARALQAEVFEQLGFGSENGTWRNAFLCGAHELRHGGFGTPVSSASPDLLDALTVDQVLSAVAIRVDGPRAWHEHLRLSFVITDESTVHRCELRNGVLSHGTVDRPGDDSTAFTLARRSLIGLITGQLDLASALSDETVVVDGDPTVLDRLMAVLAPVDPDFAIVTP